MNHRKNSSKYIRDSEAHSDKQVKVSDDKRDSNEDEPYQYSIPIIGYESLFLEKENYFEGLIDERLMRELDVFEDCSGKFHQMKILLRPSWNELLLI